ncbi:MAG: helix-turn-helix transcriptional regulator [Acidimicrobiales bacterium]
MGSNPSPHEFRKIDLLGATVPTVRHDDVREQLLSELGDAGRRQYEALGAVYEARQLTAQLAELRLAANLSQRQAAKRAGVDQADVSRIESGQITPSLPTLLRLLDAVGATLVLTRRTSPQKSASGGEARGKSAVGRESTAQKRSAAMAVHTGVQVDQRADRQ